MYRGRASNQISRPGFAPTSLVGIRMTTVRGERSAARPNLFWPAGLQRVPVRELLSLPGHQRLRERLPRGHGRHAAAAPVRRARGLVQGRARHDAGSRCHAHVRHGRRARGGLRRVAFGWRHALHGRRGGGRSALRGHRHRGLRVRLRPHRRRVVELKLHSSLPHPLIDYIPPPERALGVA